MVIKGIGVDIVEIDRIRRAMDKHENFADRLFTSEEQAYCRSRARPALHFAVRFAAKEAVSKALGSGKRGMKWTDIEIRRDRLGKPYVHLSGGAASVAAEKGIIDVAISLSFGRNSAVASAVAMGS